MLDPAWPICGAMVAVEAAIARYLYSHPGQAFCDECLKRLAAAAEEREPRPEALTAAFRASRGTCFECHAHARVLCFIPAKARQRSA